MASNSSVRIKWDDGGLRQNLAQLDNKVKMAMMGAVSHTASQAEAWAKSNARWQDQTSNARNGITARPEGAGAGRGFVARVIVAHSVPYGIWLEVRWGGRYAIIMPTVNHFAPLTIAKVGRLLNL